MMKTSPKIYLGDERIHLIILMNRNSVVEVDAKAKNDEGSGLCC